MVPNIHFPTGQAVTDTLIFSRILISQRNFQNRTKYKLYSLLISATVFILLQAIVIKLLLNLHLRDNSKQRKVQFSRFSKFIRETKMIRRVGWGGRESNEHIPVLHWHLPQHGLCYYITTSNDHDTGNKSKFFWFIAGFLARAIFPPLVTISSRIKKWFGQN